MPMHVQAQLLYASKGTIQVLTHDQVWIMPPMVHYGFLRGLNTV
jgi:hypothetical protein